MGHDECPGGERHEFPRHQKTESVSGQHDQIHAGEKCRKKWQHPQRLMLVPAIANSIKARARAPEIDDRQKKRGERIHMEMRADPRQPQRQGDVRHHSAKEKMVKGKEERGRRDCETGRIEGNRGAVRAAGQDDENRDAKQSANAPQFRDHRHRV